MKLIFQSVLVTLVITVQMTYAGPLAARNVSGTILGTTDTGGINKVWDEGYQEIGATYNLSFSTDAGLALCRGNACDAGTCDPPMILENSTPYCVDNTDHHSIRITGDHQLYINFILHPGCPSEEYAPHGIQTTYFTKGCYNVNTGVGWRSSYFYIRY